MKTALFVLLLFSFGYVTLGQETWKEIQAKGDAMKRHENSFVECNGKFYALGGRGDRSVDEFDPNTSTWSQIADAPMEISHFQAVSFEDEIWVLGALTGNYPHEPPITHAWIFNPETKNWRKGPELPAGRIRGSAGVAVREGKIYLVGGIQDGHYEGFVPWFDVLDPEKGTWEKLPDAPRARDHVSAAIVGNRLYLAGGRTSHAAVGKVLETTIKEIDYFDFETGKWETIDTTLPTPRAGNSNLGIGPYLVILNGESAAQESAHAEVEVLDTRNHTWKLLPKLNQGRHGTGVVFWEGKIYVAAGSANRGGGPELNTIEMIDWEKAIKESNQP